MKMIDSAAQGQFFRELSVRLLHEGFDAPTVEDELLPVAFNGSPLCRITVDGSVRYRREDVDTEVMSEALDKVTDSGLTR